MNKDNSNQNNRNCWRTITECVSADGCYRAKKALSVIYELSQLLVKKGAPVGCVHPDSIEIDSSGKLRVNNVKPPLASRQRYIPPEKLRNSVSERGDDIYAIGIMLLYMISGTDSKSELDSSIENEAVAETVARCTSLDPEKRFKSIQELAKFIKNKKRTWLKAAAFAAVISCIAILILGGRQLYIAGLQRGFELNGSPAYNSGYAEGFENGYSDAKGIGVGSAEIEDNCGNIPGNINALPSGAFSVIGDGVVYCSHNGKVLSLNSYTGESGLLFEQKDISSLNYYDGILYYCGSDGVYCYDPDSEKISRISDEKTGVILIDDGNFYLRDTCSTGFLYSLDAENGTLRQLNGMSDYESFCINGDIMYYSSQSDGYKLHSCKLDGSSDVIISNSSCKSLCSYGEIIYCGSEDGLFYVDTESGSSKLLTGVPVKNVAACHNGIFYICEADESIRWISPEGRTQFTVSRGPASYFNVSGRWIFYMSSLDSEMESVSTDGSTVINLK